MASVSRGGRTMAGHENSRNILKSVRIASEAEARIRGAQGMLLQTSLRVDPSLVKPAGIMGDTISREEAAGVLSHPNQFLRHIAEEFGDAGVEVHSEVVGGSCVLIIDSDICLSVCEQTHAFLLYLMTERSELVVRTKDASELRSILDEMVQSRIPELFGAP